jgi:simple sugar transport system ATP-binding protein
MEHITKRFGEVIANDHIDFEVKKGEVHALLGENGAGKSTLMRVLYGLYRPDEGNIRFCGKLVHFRSPSDAINLGIGMVHQHFELVPTLTVTENVILGLPSQRWPLLDIARAQKEILELSEKHGLKVDMNAKVWQLCVGERQRVEIIKALYRKADVLILDEPTAVLTPEESATLFQTLKSMVDEGLTIIFITHKLNEVMATSDRVTILRAGKVVSTVKIDRTNTKELARMMVGRDVICQVARHPTNKGVPILEIKKLNALNDKGVLAINDVTLTLLEGETLGIAGVSGNGQNELAEVICGLRKATEGNVFLNGRDMTNRPTRDILKQGVGYIPEDRLGKGIAMSCTIAENFLLNVCEESRFSRRGFLDAKAINRHSDKLILDFDLRTPSRDIPAKHLSGGNLQKLLLARELSKQPRLLIAVQPTRGLDVGATEYVRTKLSEKAGTSILLISEDLDELFCLSDRIAVMYEGKIQGIVSTAEADIDDIGVMMGGAMKTSSKQEL